MVQGGYMNKRRDIARKVPYVIPLFCSLLSWIVLSFFVNQSAFCGIYDLKLQFSLFTALLTVGSFLLAMKAFILVRLRDDVYEHKGYRKRYLDQYNNQYAGNYYSGLVSLGHLLALSVISAFISSIAQVTFGFSPLHAVKVIAPSMAVGVLVLVFIDWIYIYRNLIAWFDFIEEDVKVSMQDGPTAAR
jgi:hypothetical protein